ncbi:MAG: general secretion pathway protein GspK [Gammaproteobacteria bacterium]|nr:general secretion pathway protein GspK [Gammaproteobacteria bacterium]
MRPINKQSGSAIVAVLLIVAIITIISVGLMVQQRIDIRRTQQIQTATQTYRYSQAVLFWAVGVIKESEKPAVSESTDLWERNFPETTIANNRGHANGHLERLDQRTNINALSDASAQDAFVKFLSTRVPELSDSEIRSLIGNVNDWVGQAITKNDQYYSTLVPPYGVAHTPMVSPTELRLITGVDAAVYQKLIPYIITLPTSGDAKSAAGSTNGDYYLLQAEVTLDDQTLRVYSILHQEGAPPNANVTILWSTQGSW